MAQSIEAQKNNLLLISSVLQKRIAEIENHRYFRKNVDIKQIHEFIEDALTHNEVELPRFYNTKTYPKHEDWKGLPYFIRPCAIFPGHYILSVNFYVFNSLKENDKRMTTFVSLENFELLFRPIEKGFVICKVVEGKAHPIEETMQTSFRDFLEILSQENFENIAMIKMGGKTPVKSIASLINENTTMPNFIRDYFNKNMHTFGFIETFKFNMGPSKLWLTPMKKILKSANSEDQLDNLTHLLEGLEQNIASISHQMLVAFNHAMIIAREEHFKLLCKSSQNPEQSDKETLKQAKEDYEATKLILDNYFDFYYKSVLKTHLSRLSNSLELAIFEKKLIETVKQVRKERSEFLWAFYDDALEQMNAKLSKDNVITKQNKQKAEALAKAEQEYQKRIAEFKIFLKQNKETLVELVKKQKKLVDEMKEAEEVVDALKQIRASSHDLTVANKILEEKQAEIISLVTVVPGMLLPYFIEARSVNNVREHFLSLKNECENIDEDDDHSIEQTQTNVSKPVTKAPTTTGKNDSQTGKMPNPAGKTEAPKSIPKKKLALELFEDEPAPRNQKPKETPKPNIPNSSQSNVVAQNLVASGNNTSQNTVTNPVPAETKVEEVQPSIVKETKPSTSDFVSIEKMDNAFKCMTIALELFKEHKEILASANQQNVVQGQSNPEQSKQEKNSINKNNP